MKQYRKGLLLAACVLSAILLGSLQRYLVNGIPSQQLAKRWSDDEAFAQVACYFEKDAALMPEQIAGIERSLITALEEAALPAETENGGRNWVDAYSSEGELAVTSNRTTAQVRAFGVGGDFFRFHPFTLLSGTYFDSADENKDGVILDELVAWQLFGSSNVAGMEVEINGTIYPVRGVVRGEPGLFKEAVEAEKATVYVSYEILKAAYGDSYPIDSYELLIANPVKEFGINALKNALTVSEENYAMIEVSARFDFLHRLEAIKHFGVRSMNSKNIVYPYWENRAKGYEDISAALLALELLLMCYPVIWVLNWLRILYKKRKTLKQKLLEKLKNVWQKACPLLKRTVKTYKLVNRKK